MIERRKFIFTLLVLPLAGFVKADIPTKKTPEFVYSISYHLRSLCNSYYRLHKRMPKDIQLSPVYFSIFRSELLPCQRFSPYDSDKFDKLCLKFKCANVTVNDVLRHSEILIDNELYY